MRSSIVTTLHRARGSSPYIPLRTLANDDHVEMMGRVLMLELQQIAGWRLEAIKTETGLRLAGVEPPSPLRNCLVALDEFASTIIETPVPPDVKKLSAKREKTDQSCAKHAGNQGRGLWGASSARRTWSTRGRRRGAAHRQVRPQRAGHHGALRQRCQDRQEIHALRPLIESQLL